VGVSTDELAPETFALYPATPNPLNPVTRIKYDLPKTARIALLIYDLRGREVMRFEKAQQAVGRHVFTWNSRDRWGRLVPSGTYLYVSSAFDEQGVLLHRGTGKMLLLK